MKLRTALGAVALTVGTSVGGTALSTGSPVAADGDACTNAPDSGPVWNFHEACHTHDACYGQKPYGSSQWGRLQCDNDFYNNMNASCDNDYTAWWDARNGLCKDAASLYGAAVVAAGWYFWN